MKAIMSARHSPGRPRPADLHCPGTSPPRGRRMPTRRGARGQGAVTAGRRGRRCRQLGCHRAREATRAPSQGRLLRPPTPHPRSPGGAPLLSARRPLSQRVPSAPAPVPLHFLPLPHTTVPSFPPRPTLRRLCSGCLDSPGPRRLPVLTCHVPNPTAKGGASRPREGRGRHFRADKGRRHDRVGRNRPRRLPGCNLRRMRSAQASCATVTCACA